MLIASDLGLATATGGKCKRAHMSHFKETEAQDCGYSGRALTPKEQKHRTVGAMARHPLQRNRSTGLRVQWHGTHSKVTEAQDCGCNGTAPSHRSIARGERGACSTLDVLKHVARAEADVTDCNGAAAKAAPSMPPTRPLIHRLEPTDTHPGVDFRCVRARAHVPAHMCAGGGGGGSGVV